MDFHERLFKKENYCSCTTHRTLTSIIEDTGYWDVCCKCGKPIEEGFHYYNHYDGEDHDEELY